MKEKILALLRTSSDYISGQAICEKLGVSRTAVWKNINALKAEGYIIDAVNNKGYRLVGEPDIVTKEKIEAALTTSVIGREQYYYDEDGYLRAGKISEASYEITRITMSEGRKSNVRLLFHQLNQAKEKLAIVIKDNPSVYDTILDILQMRKNR